MQQKTNEVTAEVVWQMHQHAIPGGVVPGVKEWEVCPALVKAGYHGLAVRLAHKLGLPQPMAPLGVPFAMLDDAVRGVVPELPDTPPRK